MIYSQKDFQAGEVETILYHTPGRSNSQWRRVMIVEVNKSYLQVEDLDIPADENRHRRFSYQQIVGVKSAPVVWATEGEHDNYTP